MYKQQRKDNVVLVTGGGSGIGEILAQLFMQKDYYVVIVDNNKGNSQELLYQQGSHKGEFISCDVTDELQVSELFITLQQKQYVLRYLINAAAINKANWDEFLYPSQRITKYGCIMMSKQPIQQYIQSTKILEPSCIGVIIDVARGLEEGLADAKQSGLCPTFFQGRIRVIAVPMGVFTDSFHPVLLRDIAHGIFKLTTTHQKFNQLLDVCPIPSPSL